MEIEQILQAFEPTNEEYKREAVEAALEQQEAITPRLIEILEEAASNPERYFDSFQHNYAFMLLEYFHEPAAHQPITDLFSLPEMQIDPLFGDVISEDLPVALLHTSGGDMSLIKQMATNHQLYLYCRVAAISALAYAVAAGVAEREEIVLFFRELLASEIESGEEDYEFVSLLAHSLIDIYPEECMDLVERAYEEDLIETFSVHRRDFDGALSAGKEQCLARTRRSLELRGSDDVHRRMSWWACFQPQKEVNEFSPSVFAPLSSPSSKSSKSRNKSKKKQVKASRKANRKNKKSKKRK